MRIFPVHPEWPASLRHILTLAVQGGRTAVLAFDLDSTLFDNRPRQARIVREYGAARGIPELMNCTAADFNSGWDMRAPMRRCGLSAARVEALYPDLKAFWQARFFTSPYCTDDTAIQGAAAFCWEVVRTGAQLVYVTGRHEGMREGSVAAMRQSGLPVPTASTLSHAPLDTVTLLMKGTLEENDDAFKRAAHARLQTLGTLIAAFDNEPTHANDYRRRFPDALIIHLGTDHSGRDVELLPGVVTIPHFDYRTP